VSSPREDDLFAPGASVVSVVQKDKIFEREVLEEYEWLLSAQYLVLRISFTNVFTPF
jgi:hypothetical protein